jgi:hypothetical protein
MNNDDMLTIQDVVLIVDLIFRGGKYPSPSFVADVNADGILDMRDIVSLVNHVFRGGAKPTGCQQSQGLTKAAVTEEDKVQAQSALNQAGVNIKI